VADAVGLETLLRGYREALARWIAGPPSAQIPKSVPGDPQDLNWAVIVDDRLPGRWAKSDPERELVVGFRYAGNAVHHSRAMSVVVLHQ
jgi:hypothetical protein